MILPQDLQGTLYMLKELLNNSGSDKAKKHKYDEIYEPVLAPMKDEQINILEIGVDAGYSIEAWLEYLPNATIYTLDLFHRNDPASLPVLNHERVKWLKCDSTNPAVVTQIKKAWPRIRFDIIIDDGMHTPEANRKTLDNLFPLLKVRGKYFIEDVWPLDIMTTNEWKHPWVLKYPERYNMMDQIRFNKSMEGKKRIDHDHRKQTGEGDSYIIELQHA